MKSFSIRLGIFFLILLEAALQLPAQNLAETLRFAGSLLQSGDFEGGVKAYQRAAFFAPDSALEFIYSELGNAYEEQGMLEQAASYYERAFNSTGDELRSLEYAFLSIRCLIQTGDLIQARAQLYQLPEITDQDSRRREAFFWAMIHFGEGSFEQSRQFFIQCLDSAARADSVSINTIFSDQKQFFRPNPRTAQTLSLIVPGLGQFYAGDIRDGVNSMVINSGLLTLGLVVSVRYGFWNAVLTVVPWFQRYYTGGYANARSLAEKRLEVKRRMALDDVLEVIGQPASPENP